MGIRVKVSEWGNSLAIRLPKAVVEQLNLEAGDDAELELETTAAVLRAVKAKPYPSLEDMVARARELRAMGISEPEPVDWGPDRGAERWYDDEPDDGADNG